MSSDQKAVIALTNRSMALLKQLNDARRENRELRRRLDEANARLAELEASSPPLRAA